MSAFELSLTRAIQQHDANLTMDKTLTPRLPHADLTDQFELPVLVTVRLALKARLDGQEQAMSLIRTGPGRLEQRRFQGLEHDYFTIAMYYYALGYPLSDVRDSFANSAFASSKVFELRGTGSYSVCRPAPGESILNLQNARQITDYSATGSRRNFRAVNAALIGGEFGIARALAALAWDPPNAEYIGYGRYLYCTPEDQHLAYAMQDFFAGDAVGCNEKLAKIRIHPKHDAFIAQANMVRGLASDNRDAFLEGLVRMLEWHAPEARRKTNRTNPGFFLCVPAMGLTSLAIRRNLLSISALPDIANEENYFSRELIELAQASATERVELEFRSFKTNDEQSQARSEGGR